MLRLQHSRALRYEVYAIWSEIPIDLFHTYDESHSEDNAENELDLNLKVNEFVHKTQEKFKQMTWYSSWTKVNQKE